MLRWAWLWQITGHWDHTVLPSIIIIIPAEAGTRLSTREFWRLSWPEQICASNLPYDFKWSCWQLVWTFVYVGCWTKFFLHKQFQMNDNIPRSWVWHFLIKHRSVLLLFLFSWLISFDYIAGIVDMLCAFVIAVGGVRASRKLHDSLSTAILRASYYFHCTTPHGRILNRFSADITNVDLVMPFTLRSLMNTILSAIACIFVISYVTPHFLISIPPLAVIYVFIQVYRRFSIPVDFFCCVERVV